MPPKQIKPTKISRLALKTGWNGKKVVQLSYNGNFTKDEIKKYIKKFGEDQKNRGFDGELEAVLQYHPGKKGYRTMGFAPVGDPVRYYDEYEDGELDEPDTFKAFKIILLKN